jgi:hypothetical protein
LSLSAPSIFLSFLFFPLVCVRLYLVVQNTVWKSGRKKEGQRGKRSMQDRGGEGVMNEMGIECTKGGKMKLTLISVGRNKRNRARG